MDEHSGTYDKGRPTYARPDGTNVTRLPAHAAYVDPQAHPAGGATQHLPARAAHGEPQAHPAAGATQHLSAGPGAPDTDTYGPDGYPVAQGPARQPAPGRHRDADDDADDNDAPVRGRRVRNADYDPNDNDTPVRGRRARDARDVDDEYDDDEPGESAVAHFIRWVIARHRMIATGLCIFFGAVNSVAPGMALVGALHISHIPTQLMLAAALPTIAGTLAVAAVRQLRSLPVAETSVPQPRSEPEPQAAQAEVDGSPTTLLRRMWAVTAIVMLANAVAAIACSFNIAQGAIAVIWPPTAIIAYLAYNRSLLRALGRPAPAQPAADHPAAAPAAPAAPAHRAR